MILVVFWTTFVIWGVFCQKSKIPKNDYVPLGTYQNINLENFGGGPVQYFKKVPYSNFLGRTSKKKNTVYP